MIASKYKLYGRRCGARITCRHLSFPRMARESEPGALSSQGMVAAHTKISAYNTTQRSNRAALVTCCGGAHGSHHLAAPATDNSKFSALRQTLSTRQEQLRTKMCCECDSASFPLPPRRERRRTMKRTTSRKHSAQDRINMNRFWNEMEEFYSRQHEEKVEEWRCDQEVEQAMMMVRLGDHGSLEEEEDRISCYSSASSSFSESISSTPSSPSRGIPPRLDPTSPVVLSILPMPPSIPQTRALLDLVEKMQISRISTAV